MAEFLAGFWMNLEPTVVSFFRVAAAAGLALLLLTKPWRNEVRLKLSQGFWPPQRRRAVPWSFGDLALLLFLFYGSEVIVGPLCLSLGRELTGYHQPPGRLTLPEAARCVLGAAPANPFASPLPGPIDELAARAARATQDARRFSEMKWVLRGLLACRIIVSGVVIFFLLRRGVQPFQFLLTAHDWRLNLWRGFIVWFTLTLPLYLLYLALLFLKSFVGEHSPHTIEQFLAFRPDWFDRGVVIVLAVAVSPFLEELLLRGVMQPLYVEEPLLADYTILMSLLIAVLYGVSEGLSDVFSPNEAAAGWAWGPIVFLALVGPGYLGFEWLTRRLLPRPGAARAIFATSLVFALMHHSVWPTPVPLFFLGLALGWLAYRTQSLVGCITLHVLFNAVSMMADAASR